MSFSNKLSIDKLTLKDKRVLMRVDYNVPLDSDLKVEDPRRIVSTVPTIKYALENGAKSVVLMSHLGRPEGTRKDHLSLVHILPTLKEALKGIAKKEVVFVPSLDSEEYKSAVSPVESGSIFLLENLRFNVEEEGKGVLPNGEKVKADKESVDAFRAKLSRLGDVFVFDAFAAAHRAHSSVVGIDLPQRAAGFLMKKELTYFSKALESPKKPFLSILGGAKVSDKILLIESLLDKVDEMIIGGGMAYTFLKVLNGTKIGDSLFDEKGSRIVENIMKKAKEKNVKIHLPLDFVIADKFSPTANTKVCSVEDGIPDGWMGLDCGEKSVEAFSQVISRAKTVVWNGPLGVFEFEKFANGTNKVLAVLAKATEQSPDFTSIIGGGDTASAAEKLGVAAKMSHVSTGGGASLELLEGKTLPGVQHLSSA